MATLRDIRQRISGTKSMAKITSAMKMVSASKMRRAQIAIESARPYVQKLEATLSNLVAAVSQDYAHPLLREEDNVKSVAIIVIGSDKGLCGSFNTSLFRHLNQYIQDDIVQKYPDAGISLITIGKRSGAFFKHSPYNIVADYPGIFAKLRYEDVKAIINKVKFDFIEGKYDRVYVCYNEYVNVIRQLPSIKTILPIEANSGDGAKMSNVDYIFEPGKAEIVNDLLPRFVDMTLWRYMLESNAAEEAARMMAMDNATNNANTLITDLEMMYNKARQAAITTEMLEIVGGAEALKSN